MSRSTKSEFNQNELRFYSRQIAMPQLGNEGQLKLKKSKIAVIGAGGLGAPVLQYLAAAGIGTIGIFDFDVVEESNLHRQILFTVSDIGKPKARIAAEQLNRLNPHVKILPHQTRITSDNASQLLTPYDLVIDGSDNFLTRYIINDACLVLDIPLVYGSIFRFEGQVTVFNHVDEDGNRGPELYDLYPEVPEEGFIPDCSTAGVLGVLPGVIGSIQATEAIKISAGIGDILSGKLLVMDLLNLDTHFITFSTADKQRSIDKASIENRLRSYKSETEDIRQLSPRELSELMESSDDIRLIDVRAPEEHQVFNIGGRLVPLDKIEDHVNQIPKNGKIVFYCQTGQRSARAIRVLKKRIDGTNLYNLAGGIEAWLVMNQSEERV